MEVVLKSNRSQISYSKNPVEKPSQKKNSSRLSGDQKKVQQSSRTLPNAYSENELKEGPQQSSND